MKVSPHVLRHSKAMHMLQAGVNLVYIRDFLGHAHVETTEIYAKADTEMKRRAIETARIPIDPNLPSWTENKGLMALLNSLCGAERNILWKESVKKMQALSCFWCRALHFMFLSIILAP